MSNPFPTNTGGDPDYEPGDHSKASESKITTPEQDQAIQEDKLRKLDSYFDQKIQAHLTVLTANLQEHASKIDMILEAIQGATKPPEQQGPQQEQPQQMPSLSSLPPQIQGELLTGIAQIIQAWKGGGKPEPTNDYFSEMSKNITLNMLQAGVDGIMRNVYDNYNPVPPNARIRPQPNTEHKLH